MERLDLSKLAAVGLDETAAIGETFPNAAVTVDWFHVVQLFTKALDEVRRAEAKNNKLPKALRWAILKKADGKMTEAQAEALAELEKLPTC